ncbi:tetratricopeptide repeat protein [Vampirovibrio sp.]|uniref:tetratricopeptide repeat protein n=1 Tax=Vampirovibrio sp. TaxID=2717857 RepID=UPI0035934FE5
MQTRSDFLPTVRTRVWAFSTLLTLAFSVCVSSSLVGWAQPTNAPTPYDVPDDYSSSGDLDQYARFSQQGSDAFNKGQLTQSIESFERALTVAPAPSLPVVYNNLAVVYIKRGNYYHDKQRQDQNALSDFRKAYFYLESAWPEGMERKPLHEKNRLVAKDNLNIAYRNLNINAADKNRHLDMAKQLRLQGKFPEAIVEYGLALDLDKNDSATAKALGDLFTVVNLPEKSKRYYSLAVKDSGSAIGGNAETLVQLGNAQYKTGEIDKAVVNFDKALTVDPDNVSALNMLEKIWQNEIKFNPSSVLGHANLGSVFQKKRMYEQAYQQYNAAEHFSEMDRNTPFEVKKMIRLNMGTLFQQQKQHQKALSAYNTVLQVEPNHLLANFYKATLLQDTGNADGAIEGYNKVLTVDPNYRPAQEKMLALIKQQSDPGKVAAGLRKYADRFASNATVQAQIGEEFHDRKDLEAAAFFYKRALAINPKQASAWANLGAIYQTQGKGQESADAFQKAQALEPENETFKSLAQSSAQGLGYQAYQQAVQLQREGKTQEALPLFKKALMSNDTPEIHAAYGISLQTAGQLDAAIAEYQKAMSQDANTADYAYYLGTAYHQKKDLPKAQAAYQKALSLRAGYPEAQQALASINLQGASQDLENAIEAYNGKRYPQALSLVNQALAKNNQDAMAHYYKGLILDGQKKPSLAAQSYRDAIKYNADFTDAYYALGVALDTAKDTTGAKSAFERFIGLSGTNDTEDDFVKYARERVKAIP